MANRTVKDAHSIHGTNPQYLVEKIIRTRIYESKYWKEECFGLTGERARADPPPPWWPRSADGARGTGPGGRLERSLSVTQKNLAPAVCLDRCWLGFGDTCESAAA